MNRILKKAFGIGALALTLGFSGCRERKTEYSEIKNEEALVTERQYTPSSTNKEFVFDLWDGDFRLEDVYHPERFDITFDGKVDFSMDNKEVYDRFRLEQWADVYYREVYSAVYDDKDKDGKNELIERKFESYEFLDAQPKRLRK